MKTIFTVLVLTGMLIRLDARETGFQAISFSYLGEMITHPGIRLGLDYPLRQWENSKSMNELQISPTLGFYTHRRYQTALFFIPDIRIMRQNQKGGQIGAGLGLGYLRTFIPNTYEVGSDGQVQKTLAGYHYLATSVSLHFGRMLNLQRREMGYYVRPQFVFATPGFPRGTGYFWLELGIQLKLNRE